MDFNNLSSYRLCSRKAFSSYICMPELGTYIINKVKDYDIYKLFQFEYLSPEMYARMNTTWRTKFDSLVSIGRVQRVTMTKRFVKAGVLGELDAVSLDSLQDGYIFATGEAISLSTIARRSGKSSMSWQKIIASPTDYQEYACFVPLDYKFLFSTVDSVNTFDIPHGLGDFIVYTLVNNQFCNGRVVNGRVFALQYNNVNWRGKVETDLKEVTINELPNIGNQGIDYNEDSEEKFSFAELVKLDLEAKRESAYLFDINIMQPLSKNVLCIDMQWYAIKRNHCNKDIYYLVYNRSGKSPEEIERCCIIKDYIFEVFTYKEFMEELCNTLGIVKAGIESSFIPSIGSIEELACINNYTKSGFSDINQALYNGKRLDFKNYLIASTIYTYLKRCNIRENVCLYRGLKSKRRIYEGYVLNSNNFLSTSISFKSVLGFGTGLIMRFKHTKNLEGLYINTISNSRNAEYEVLINAGYNIKFVKQVGVINEVEIWDCEVVPDKTFKMLKNQNKVIDTTLNILNNHRLRNYFYITKCTEDFDLCEIEFSALYNNASIVLTFNEKNVIIVFNQEGKRLKKSLRLSKDNLYLKIIKIFDKCLEIYQSSFSIITGSALYRIGCDVIFNISSKFVYEGFILLGQRIITKRFSDDYEFKANITLNGDEDDNITIAHKFMCTTLEKCTLNLSAKSDKVEKSCTLSGSLRKVDSLINKVFNFCLQNFNLNYSRRIDKVIAKIANYLEMEVSVEKARDCIIYTLEGGKVIYVKMDGTNVNYATDKSYITADYFDNLNVVASKLFEIVGE